MTPTVSFVVPCYKLGHLLAECVTSILSQTYGDFEILIMDDCSPDNTPEVARSFNDPRVIHVRNERNLGHLSNYNKGIQLSRGKYIWLISADDRLEVNYALEKYVAVMEQHPSVGYVCCTGIELVNGRRHRVAPYSVQAHRDAVFRGKDFLRRLLSSNSIIAAAGMVRRECYDSVGMFPLDLPYAGDWFLWCVLALRYDVAYCAEPMVAYRLHTACITERILDDNAKVCADNDVMVLWRVMREVQKLGAQDLLRPCMRAIAYEYARQLLGKTYRGREFRRTEQQCADSISQFTHCNVERQTITALMLTSAGDLCVQAGAPQRAMRYYERANRIRRTTSTALKLALVRTGRLGAVVRRCAFTLRHA
ncbi:MAG TPA: glycosyltransferase [Candidatus Acidoferrum sp.]|nr:glycosyltransferase [Candidatus Acidoferrum sp.]